MIQDDLDLLLPGPPSGTDGSWSWATVTSVSPLRVRMDGESLSLPVAPDSLIGGLAVGNRVWTQQVGRRLMIVGKAGGQSTLITRQIGEVFWWPGGRATIPVGCLEADGSAQSRTTYSALYNIIGTTYGAGDGSSTFNLPNMQGRVPVGLDGSAEFSSIGQKAGEKAHILSVAEMPPHAPGLTDPGHSHLSSRMGPSTSNGDWAGFGGGGQGGWGVAADLSANNNIFHNGPVPTDTKGTGITLTNVGGGGAHNNLQPYIVGLWLIKAAYNGSEISPNSAHVHAIADVTGLQAQLSALQNGVDIFVTANATYVSSVTGSAKCFGKHVDLTLQLKFVAQPGGFVTFATIPVAYAPYRPAGGWGIVHGVGRNETRGGSGFARMVYDGTTCGLSFGDSVPTIQNGDNVSYSVSYAIP